MKDLGFNIGAVRLNNPLILAPLAGITDPPFRQIVKEHGAALTVTEMISAAGLGLKGVKTLALLERGPEEKPFCVQLFGTRPDWLARAAVMAEELGADIIDLNLGCPARKVVRHGGGAALLRDFKLIEDILTAVRRAVKVPLTVKTRAGWKPGEGEVLDLAPILAQGGVDAVTLHPRYAVQRFSGRADWDLVARLVERFPGPVIGNGDVTRPEQVLTHLRAAGCAGLMIGRGALGNPWLFSQSLTLLAGGTVETPTLAQRLAVAQDHALRLGRQVGPKKAVLRLRSILAWYTKGLPEAASFRQFINHETDFQRMIEGLTDYFHWLDEEQPKDKAA
ncbi:MAG: tRNA dihydrouridine synthase DusB [Thermodesulfobacteriota bacterium]